MSQTYDSTSESLLLRLRSVDDHSAWARFVELYTPLMFFWARKMGLAQQDASDLVQEILTLLVRKLPEFELDSNKSFRAWLRTVTHNKFKEMLRRKSLTVVDASYSLLLNISDDADSEFWEREYQERLVHRAIELARPDFEPGTWNALKEFITSERPAADIANDWGVSIWTLYSAKSRLLSRLKREIRDLIE